MKPLSYGKLDFPNGFDSSLLLGSLLTNHGKNFSLTTSSESVNLTLDDADDPAPIDVTCRTHFALTAIQRAAALADLQAQAALNPLNNQFNRFLLAVHYDTESRLRVLEGKAAITKQQYTNALIAIYKAS